MVWRPSGEVMDMGSIRITRRAAVRKQRRPGVESLEVRTLLSTSSVVGPFSPGVPQTAGSPYGGAGVVYDPIVGASAARDRYKVDGTGMTVAVIDTGVNYNHQALGGGFGAGKKVVAGYDFSNESPDPLATAAQHGTSVAGLIASSDPAHPGVAPGAGIAALRVFNDSNQGDFNKVAEALQWVVDNRDTYHVTAVNLSMSDGRNYTQNWFASDGGIGQKITGLVQTLSDLNIPVVTAAGNSFAGVQGEGFTAIIPQTISVTSTDVNDNLVSNAQRLGVEIGGASATDLAAPGDGLSAPVDGNNFATVTGTSFSTPVVTGAIVLLQQVYESRFNALPKVSDLDAWLQAGADSITDSVTGITIGRLDIPRAIAQIPNPAAQILAPPAAPVIAPPVVVTPPAPVVTVPPVDAAPPAPETPPAVTSGTTPVAPPTGTIDLHSPDTQLWVNGRQVTSADLSQPAGVLSTLPSALARALQSLKSWWSGSNTAAPAASQVKLWNAQAHPGNSQPAGSLKKVATAAGKAKAATAAQTAGMNRAWHTFGKSPLAR